MSEEAKQESPAEGLPIEAGSPRLDYPRTGFNRTIIVIVVAMVLVFAFGALSAMQGRDRHNAVLLPRKLEFYAAYPDGSMRYVSLNHPADMVLVDDEADFDPQEVTVRLPDIVRPSGLISADPFGGSLIEETVCEMDAPVCEPVYTLRREIFDGQYYGVDARLGENDILTANSLAVDVSPQDHYALKFVVLGVPDGSENIIDAGTLSAYRITKVAGWRLYYYDVTLLEGDETISLTWDALRAAPSDDVSILKLDENR